VWCRSAFSAGVCDRDGDRYLLAPHVATLLLDPASPAYAGGVFTVLEQPEMFGRFETSLDSGARMWWDDTSPDWIANVATTGTPFYTRLVPGGLAQVPGRVMGAIQFFEAQIDDQLLPRAAYDDLLGRHGYGDLGTASITPMHAITWGRRPLP
jgi:hypothetical protein